MADNKKNKDISLETLLQLDGEIFPMDKGYWVKFKVRFCMATKVMKVGIISKKDYMERTLAIAKGNYKPRKGEPTVWFESVKSMSQVLSSENQELLRVIINHKPHSITELEKITSRKKSNLSRTLKTLEKYGIVELKKIAGKIIPKVKATDFKVEFGLHYSSPTHQIYA